MSYRRRPIKTLDNNEYGETVKKIIKEDIIEQAKEEYKRVDYMYPRMKPMQYEDDLVTQLCEGSDTDE